ncbi:MAG TPA: CRTAC1 family protein [Thermoanaerobaculia bacterium]|nr:CRTAC1 family protein [Thermoanaerobaculia bacterium]
MRSLRRLLPALLAAAALAAGLAAGLAAAQRPAPAKAPKGPEKVLWPDPDDGVAALAERRKAQIAAAGEIRVFHDFRFEDRVRESGITFVQRIVDDAGKTYKAVHYDHGNGIAVADVDGDGLPDIYFVNQIGGNELWKNLGNGRFRNITKEAGVALADRISVSASFADFDNDGDEDLFVTTVRGGNVLFQNDGKGHFKDISREAGVDYIGHSSGAVFFDYDRDGFLDLFVCNVGRYTENRRGRGGAFVGLPDAFSGHLYPDRSESSILYHNLGGKKFEDVSAKVLSHSAWTGDASVADINGDGWPDLYVLNMQGDDHYYENQKGEKFVEKTDAHFPKTPWGTMGIKFFDYDNDGRPDLLLTDMHSDMSEEIGPDREKLKSRMQWTDDFLQGGANNIFGNALYHNLGDGKFEEVSDRMGVENYWPWGPSVGDLNADGWDDIFIASSMNFPFRYGINSLLLNDRGEKFADSEFILGVEPRKGGKTHTPWFEFDCAAATDAEKRQFCKGKNGPILVMATLGSRSAAIFDLDGDGDLDIVTNDFNSAPQVFVSDLAQKKKIHWLKVRLAGSASNRDGLGAAVRVRAGGKVYTKWNDGKSGYLSQSALPLYFGLGDAASIEAVEVDWPSGRKQVVGSGLRINSTLSISEPK